MTLERIFEDMRAQDEETRELARVALYGPDAVLEFYAAGGTSPLKRATSGWMTVQEPGLPLILEVSQCAVAYEEIFQAASVKIKARGQTLTYRLEDLFRNVAGDPIITFALRSI